MSPVDNAVSQQSQTGSVETPSINYLVQVGLLVSAYVVSARLGFALAFSQSQATPIHPHRNYLRRRAFVGTARAARDHPKRISSKYSNHSRARILDPAVYQWSVLAPEEVTP